MSRSSTVPTRAHQDLAIAWYRRIRRAQHDHGRAAGTARRWATIWTVGGLGLGVLAGGSYVADLLDLDVGLRPALSASLAVVGVVATAVPSLTDLGGSRARHERASRDFGRIRRELAITALDAELSDVARYKALQNLKTQMDAVALASPNIPDRLWKKSLDQDDYFPPEFGHWRAR
ncbi:hypothetical protein ACNI3K_07960 [Demequina sp. SO4-13]|uniref:hypothetical protein n=1 Tax=Demequina sp. SO4-13 TaxID=3401027 RepID=UPI003AF90190